MKESTLANAEKLWWRLRDLQPFTAFFRYRHISRIPCTIMPTYLFRRVPLTNVSRFCLLLVAPSNFTWDHRPCVGSNWILVPRISMSLCVFIYMELGETRIDVIHISQAAESPCSEWTRRAPLKNSARPHKSLHPWRTLVLLGRSKNTPHL